MKPPVPEAGSYNFPPPFVVSSPDEEGSSTCQERSEELGMGSKREVSCRRVLPPSWTLLLTQSYREK